MKNTLVQMVLLISSIKHSRNNLMQTIPIYRGKKTFLKDLYIPASSNEGTFSIFWDCDPCPSFWTFVEYNFTWFSVQHGTLFEKLPNVMKTKPAHPERWINQKPYKYKENHTGHILIKLPKIIEQNILKTIWGIIHVIL